MLFSIVFGVAVGYHVLFRLPEIPLPDWAAGVRLGGAVTAEQLLQSLYLGLQLATIVVCIGAANSLASPSRLLKSVPAALYEVGVAVVVAMTFAPQLVADVARVRTAQRLRGRRVTGLRGFARSVLPVLEGALERAVALAAAMDSRGYGRTAGLPRRARVMSAALLLLGLLGACVGVYGLLDSGTAGSLGAAAARRRHRAGGRGPGAGRAAAACARATVPTRGGRPSGWSRRAGWCRRWSSSRSRSTDPVTLVGQYAPLAWPELPLLAALAVLVALVPGVAAPLPPGRPVHEARPARPEPASVAA